MKYDGIKYDYLTFGTRGTIYVNKEQESCIKLFNRETKPLDRTNKILRKIKNLNLVNIYKIQEIIYLIH